jgi:hypothetical protein
MALQGDMTAVAELAWRSAALYRKAGHPDSAAQVLERAGQPTLHFSQKNFSINHNNKIQLIGI